MQGITAEKLTDTKRPAVEKEETSTNPAMFFGATKAGKGKNTKKGKGRCKTKQAALQVKLGPRQV